MAKRVQFRRGTSTQYSSFTGALGEVTVDTTLKTLRVHDNVKVGGNIIATIDCVKIVVNSVSEMIALPGIEVGSTVQTEGYYIPGDGGGNDYEIVAAGTGTDDGGSFIDLSGSGLQAKGLFVDGVFNILQFGAPTDGVTDSSTSIKKCYDYVHERDGGYIKHGSNHTFSIMSGVTPPDKSILDLSGSTILRAGNISMFRSIHEREGVPGESLTIKNGTLDARCTLFPGSGNIIGMQCNNAKYINIKFLDVAEWHALDIVKSSHVLVSNCSFLGMSPSATPRESIQVDGQGFNSYDVTIEYCYFGPNLVTGTAAPQVGIGNHSLTSDAMGAYRVRVVGCTFDSCTYAALRPYAWTNTRISNNHIIMAPGANGIEVMVGDYTSTKGSVSTHISGNSFIATSASNPAIFIQNDNEPVGRVNSIISVVGNDFELHEDTLCIRAEDTRNLSVSGNVLSGGLGFLGIYDALNTTVTGNVISSNKGTAFFINGASSGVTISGNTVSDIASRFVHITGLNGSERKNISITGNTVTDVAGAAYVAVDSGTVGGITVTGNSFCVGGINAIPTEYTVRLATVGGNNLVANNTIPDAALTLPYAGYNGSVIHVETNGSPEGVVTAGVGSTIRRKDGGVNSTLYVKESGTGPTGWVAK